MAATCTRSLLSLCSVPKAIDREGHAGSTASVYVPFYGRVFASGAQYTYPSSTIGQDRSRVGGGASIPDVFTKGFVKA